MTTNNNLSCFKIFKFWVPLAATWLMMSFEGPFLAAVIARLGEAKFNLAAYGVAYSIALILEAPIIMIMSAATALVKNEYTYRKLRNFTNILNSVIFVLMGILLIPRIFNFVAVDLIGLPQNVADLTYWSTFILLPWPAAIGYRRFYQGVLISKNLTRRVAYGTVIRLVSMTATAIMLYHYFQLSGAYVGATALSVGVVLEALASRIMAKEVVAALKNIPESDIQKRKTFNYRYISKFYYPLALTSLISLAVHPMVTFFVGQSRMALESLAILPVVNSLVFIFRSLGLSFQEVGIVWMDKDRKYYKRLRNFALGLAGFAILCLSSIAFTPLSGVWYGTISGLKVELSDLAIVPTQIMVLMPALTVWLSFQRAILVVNKTTHSITMATILEFGTILLILFGAIHWLDLVGAVAATSGFILGRVAANFYLIKPYNLSLTD